MRGFTLIEILIVMALMGILAGISTANFRAALLMVKVQATASDMGVVQNAVKSVSADCGTLPRWNATTDPGFMSQPAWATGGCWKGPYLNYWLMSTPLGGNFRYVGTAGNAPIVRVAGIDQASARLLAVKIQSQFGATSLGSVSKSGSTWSVDLTVRDAVNVK